MAAELRDNSSASIFSANGRVTAKDGLDANTPTARTTHISLHWICHDCRRDTIVVGTVSTPCVRSAVVFAVAIAKVVKERSSLEYVN